MIDPFATRIVIPLQVVPMFGVAPHTPAIVALARPAKGPRRKVCPTCGPGVPKGSVLYCCTCDRGSPALEQFAGRHALAEWPYNRMKGPPPKAKPAKPAKPPRLTAKDRKALMRDARAGEHPLPIVELFLASQPA